MNKKNRDKKNKTIANSVVLFFVATLIINAQQRIMGTVVEETSNSPVPYVNILIKKANSSGLLAYAITDEKGSYEIELTEEIDSISIETSIISHLPKMVYLFIDKNKSRYEVNFTLKERINELNEINIKASKSPITVNKDTTFYNVSAFKDGSERVVEDILKKLPGISIENNGLIKFKGKQVTRVLLDGDNIFDDNYTIGTKNIDSEIIESIQAIEDYNKNPLLKGIKSSDDVAVNLTLKEGKTDFSGNAALGLGFDSKKVLKANTISVSKRLKGFSTLSYNNIGENYSPFNFLSNTLELSKANEQGQRANNLVNNTGFNSNLPDNRVSLNDNFLGSVNFLYKANKKLSFRTNYNFFKDKLKRNELNAVSYFFNEENLSLVNTENTLKRPLINVFDFELIYNVNSKSLLTSIGKLDSQIIEKSSMGFNNNDPFKSFAGSRDFFIKSETEYTYKINTSNVIQFSINGSSNDIPQNMDVYYESIQLNQDIDIKKSNLKLQASLLTKTEKSEFKFDFGHDFSENFINSNLQGLDSSNQFLVNDNYYRSAKTFFNSKFNFRIGKWKFVPELKANFYNVKLKDANLQDSYEDTFINFQPALLLNYSLNEKSQMYARYTLSNQMPDANNVYSGLILINNRSLLNNDFRFNLFDNHLGSIGYRINDFYNLFQFNTYLDYGYKKYGLIQQFNIDENYSFSTNIVDTTKNHRLSFGLEFEKYVDFLKSTINLNSSYSVLEYQNIVNNSGLRQNKSKTLFGKLSIRTGFKGSLNFENDIFLTNNTFTNSSNISTSLTSLQNDFQVKYIRDNFQLSLSSQYFKQDLNDQVEGDLFLDSSLSFRTKNNKMEYSLKANNLLNKKIYRNISSSDFSNSVFEHNLQERFLLLSVQFKF